MRAANVCAGKEEVAGVLKSKQGRVIRAGFLRIDEGGGNGELRR